MKPLHITAAVCFGLATLFYMVGGWVSGATALGVLGVGFEACAWIAWFIADANRKTD